MNRKNGKGTTIVVTLKRTQKLFLRSQLSFLFQ